MKKAQKEQAESIIRLLGNVHDGIKKAVERGQYDSARELLSQCQESAIELGETIEAIEGEGFVTVSYLENYCEAVYQAYTLLSQPVGVNASRVYKSLRRALIPAENSVKNDIRIRREAVFLPYKASMWDSLESVWKAADEDPDCDAYVIPIPYYDKNPDGSFREMHYEGDQYPEYVPVTWYEDYDFTERQPDMIFIHNPYDECNYVTSVHPFFYAKNLKQFTEKLVYIPYFILGEPDLENEESIKGMAHFCTVPGVIYADKVIVQSEAMRQAYIRVMVEFTAKGREVNEEANRKYWEEKIEGSGSPKVEKLLRTKKEDLEIPEEWLKVICKEDGSWKKIVFYNTSVTALLEHGEKMLTKMRDVFRVFYENREEIALLWRPHPLLPATIQSMRPELWEVYKEIVREYKEAGWGIYDDSAELDRAIAISNGYYGDRSSIVQLYQKTKRLIMIQNVMKQRKISCQNIWIEGNEAIIAAWDVNRIYKYDLQKQKCICISEYEPKSKKIYAPYGDIYKYRENRYLFSPLMANEILIYDTVLEKFKFIPLKSCEETVWLDCIVPYDDFLFLIPGNYNFIVRFNCVTEDIDYVGDCVLTMKLEFGKTDKEIFRHGYALLENNLYLASVGYQGIVLKINLLSLEFEYIKLAHDVNFTSICGDNGKVWLTTADGKIVEWCLGENIIKQYICQDNQKEKCVYFDIIKKDNYIIALPWNSKDITVLEQSTEKIINIKLEEKIDEDMICMFGKLDGDYLYTFSHTTKKLYKICLLTLKKEREYIIMEPEKDDVEFWEGYIEPLGDNTFYERNSNSLIQYINYI